MKDLTRYVSAFAGKPLTVLGDLVVDEYIQGTTSRISREAPVLVVREERRERWPGGAANVVANLRALGAQPRPVGLVGDDRLGETLGEQLAASGVDCAGIVTATGRLTTTKTRVLAGGRDTVRQQMLRIDRLSGEPIAPAVRRTLLERLERTLGSSAGLVISDYGEGVVEGEVMDAVLQHARADGAPVFVDSRFRVARYRGADTLTPNVPELSAASGVDPSDSAGMEKAGRWLLQATGCRMVLLKRGRNGMALFQAGRDTQTVPAFGSVEVADATGAGDTVLAAWALARAAGAEPIDAMGIANAAGGIQVTKAGTAVVHAVELAEALARLDACS